MLGDAATGYKDSKVFSQIGLGILIKNDYLVINTFQLSISFYPSIPGVGQGVFKMNSFKTNDFGFGDFVLIRIAMIRQMIGTDDGIIPPRRKEQNPV